MLMCVFSAAVLFLCVLGIFFSFYVLMGVFLCQKDKDGIYTLVYYDGCSEKLYDRVYTAYFQSDLFSFCNKRAIAVIGNKIPDYVKNQCCDIIAPYGKILFLESDEIHLLNAENICSDD